MNTLSVLHQRAPSTDLTPIIIIRWMMAFAQLMAVMASQALWETSLPYAPMMMLIAAAAVMN